MSSRLSLRNSSARVSETVPQIAPIATNAMRQPRYVAVSAVMPALLRLAVVDLGYLGRHSGSGRNGTRPGRTAGYRTFGNA